MITRLASATDLVRFALAAWVFAWSAWWCVLSCIALRRPSTVRGDMPPRRWLVIVPAHNEELMIAACIQSLQAAGRQLASPPTILVVADNCEDATATIARAAGAMVIERRDLHRRGKGFALELAISRVGAGLTEELPEILAFVDADSLVDAQFLVEMQRAMDRGASAAQAYYEVSAQPGDLTGLRRLAFMALHWSRPLGLSRLHLGSGMKGNGMALRWDVAAQGLGSDGIAEDAAMTLSLAERGIPVTFVPGARVSGFMAATYRDAQVQDDRWERGRARMMPRSIALAARLLVRGKPAAAAGALDVASPPLSLVGALAVSLAAAQIVVPARGGWLSLAALSTTIAYVPLALLAARASWHELAALRMAPRFALYKLLVLLAMLRPGAATEWRRTSRPGDR